MSIKERPISEINEQLQHSVDEIKHSVDEIKPKLRGWLHAATAPLAFFSFLVMLVLTESTRVRVGIAVFMVSALLLFTTSAIYHTGHWSARAGRVWRRLDHANIFVLIAGSTTPFAILLLTDAHVVILLSITWGGALLGVVFKVFWLSSPRWLHVPIYLALGWAPVIFIADFVDDTPVAPLILLATGGLLYSIGALVYGVRRPDPSPTYFGFHEVFHSLTIAAFFVHYIGISLLAYQQH